MRKIRASPPLSFPSGMFRPLFHDTLLEKNKKQKCPYYETHLAE